MRLEFVCPSPGRLPWSFDLRHWACQPSQLGPWNAPLRGSPSSGLKRTVAAPPVCRTSNHLHVPCPSCVHCVSRYFSALHSTRVEVTSSALALGHPFLRRPPATRTLHRTPPWVWGWGWVCYTLAVGQLPTSEGWPSLHGCHATTHALHCSYTLPRHTSGMLSWISRLRGLPCDVIEVSCVLFSNLTPKTTISTMHQPATWRRSG
ncbi:hypothetical protein F5B21DRAFT_393904 [Xylaria acuta]|nr:hypothetical protein F5B21DRAFT_393904 [Xylaria acuta]